METAAAPVSPAPRTVEDIFKDFSNRRSALVRALTVDVEDFYRYCDQEKENSCLYGHPNGSWEVALPAEEVPPEMPEPALGINFARDGMHRRDWLSLVAVHSDSWLLSVAFFFGARLNANERKRLFSMINDQPTVLESLSMEGIINLVFTTVANQDTQKRPRTQGQLLLMTPTWMMMNTVKPFVEPAVVATTQVSWV
ncbi:hypothetical protein VPH35_036842 [Triticum aestivum]